MPGFEFRGWDILFKWSVGDVTKIRPSLITISVIYYYYFALVMVFLILRSAWTCPRLRPCSRRLLETDAIDVASGRLFAPMARNCSQSDCVVSAHDFSLECDRLRRAQFVDHVTFLYRFFVYKPDDFFSQGRYYFLAGPLVRW